MDQGGLGCGSLGQLVIAIAQYLEPLVYCFCVRIFDYLCRCFLILEIIIRQMIAVELNQYFKYSFLMSEFSLISIFCLRPNNCRRLISIIICLILFCYCAKIYSEDDQHLKQQFPQYQEKKPDDYDCREDPQCTRSCNVCCNIPYNKEGKVI